MTPKFVNGQPAQNESAQSEADQSHPPEEVHRTSEILQQKLDGDNVEQHVEGSADAIMRTAMGAIDVANGNFGDARSVKACEGRNEAMELAVQVNVLDDFGAVRFEGGAEIAQIHNGGARHHPVGD